MPNPYSPYIKIGLIVILCAALFFGYRSWRAHVYNQGVAACEAAHVKASSEAKDKAHKAGDQAVTGVIHANDADVPAVDAAAANLLHICPDLRLQSPGSPVLPDAAAKEAEVRRTLSDAADDIRTCQSELNRFTGLQVWARKVSE